MLLTLADFLAGLLRGFTLTGLTLAVGGVAWASACCGRREPTGWSRSAPLSHPRCSGRGNPGVGSRPAPSSGVSVLSLTLGRPALADLFATTSFMAGLVRTLLALGLAATALRLRAAPGAYGWAVLSVLTGVLMLCGAWRSSRRGPFWKTAPCSMPTDVPHRDWCCHLDWRSCPAWCAVAAGRARPRGRRRLAGANTPLLTPGDGGRRGACPRGHPAHRELRGGAGRASPAPATARCCSSKDGCWCWCSGSAHGIGARRGRRRLRASTQP